MGASATLRGAVSAGTLWSLAQVVLLAAISATHSARGVARGISLPRVGLLFAFGACAGVNVGSWVAQALQTAGACPRVSATSPTARLARAAGLHAHMPFDLERCTADAAALSAQAFALTAGLYAAFAAAGLFTSRADAHRVASLLLPLTWIVFGAQLCAALGFGGASLADTLYVRLGMLVYAGRVFVDTSAVAARVRDTCDSDVVAFAVDITSGALHLFIRLVTLLAEYKAKEEVEKQQKEQELRRKRT